MVLLTLKSTLLLTLLYTGFIGFIRVRPYDDSLLRELAESSHGCVLPCFMGIRPDVTTDDEAVAILESHPWVRSVDYTWSPDASPREGWLTWEWSAQRPAWVHSDYLGFLIVTDGTVRGMALDTTIALGDVVTAWGAPERMSERGRFWFLNGSIKLEIPYTIFQSYFEFDAYHDARIPRRAFAKHVEMLIGNLPLDCREFHDWPNLPIIVNRSIGAFCGEPA